MDNKRLKKMLQPRFGLYFIAILAFTAMSLIYSIEVFLVEIILCLIICLYHFSTGHSRYKEITGYIDNITLQISAATTHAIADFPIPVLITTAATGNVIWHNDEFSKIIEDDGGLFQKNVKDVIEGFETNWVMDGRNIYPNELKILNRYFTVYGNIASVSEDTETLLIMYFLESTEKVETLELFAKTRPVVSIIAIDNFDELLKNATDSEKSSLIAKVDKKIGEWAKKTDGILRKYDSARYIYIFEDKNLTELIEEKFSILDSVRTITSAEGINTTLSIGIGKDGESFDEKFRFAALALDMALSRGGDQVVIKNKFAFEFFGGHSKEVEKRTKVKSRVMANALKQLMIDSSKVYVMGHKVSDIDSLGAAVGVVVAARECQKPVRIVIDKTKTLATPMIQKLLAAEEYKGVFITPEDAMLEADSDTLLVVVDTNRPDFVESPELLESVNKVAVIDHHRRAASYIENCAVNMHEPYASSASELVAELLQYIIENKRLLRLEAECLLAGIFLDTKGFTIKAGVRTFEAAAYLKRAGADMVEVKKLFQNSFDAYMQKQRIIACAKYLKHNVIVAVADFDVGRESAAQAADEMLGIAEVDATFIVFINNMDVIISARSLGGVNVQVIMEKLNGGGNLTAAGAQIENGDIYQIEEKLEVIISEYFDKNNLK